MLTSDETIKSKGRTKRAADAPATRVYVGTLSELEDYTDDVIKQLNRDTRLALIAVGDPVGVLSELGYDLSKKAVRQLKRTLPRMSHQDRDRYLARVRSMGSIPESLDIKLSKRPKGLQPLAVPLETASAGTQNTAPKGNPGATMAKGTAGFDAVMQYGEGFCEKMLQRHYADGRLPRSVYEIGGKLRFFHHTGDYEDYRASLGDADREVHFSKPSMDFVPGESSRLRLSSPFVAIGFDAKPVKGVATVFGTLALAKDSYGHPSFIDVRFDGLKAGDTSVQTIGQSLSSTTMAKLKGTIHGAWRDFRKQPLGWYVTSLDLPISFALIHGGTLVQQGVAAKPGEVVFGVRKPPGGKALLLSIGFNRAERKGSGSIKALKDHIKTGGHYAFLQDAAWLEQGANASFSKALPVRFDPDSGKKDPNGDLRLDSIVWNYRKGGLTGKMTATYEDYALWIDKELKGETYVDVQFHTSDPEMTVVGSANWEDLRCLAIVLSLLGGALVGGLFGGLIGFGIGLLTGAPLVGAFAGAAAPGAVAGVLTACYLWGLLPASFDASGLPAGQKQTVKLTHQQALPVIQESVQVVPNDLQISEAGTLMSAKLVGPAFSTGKPYVVANGAFLTKLDILPQSPKTPAASEAVPEGQAPTLSGPVALSGASVSRYVLGWISMFYAIQKTWGLQGALECVWTFNGTPIGNGPSVRADVPITADMFGPGGILLDRVNHLGTVRLVVEDAFGRQATWEGAVSMGSNKDFRPLRAPGWKRPEWMEKVDLLNELANRGPMGPPDPGPVVGWALGDGDVVVPQGMLVTQTTLTSPELSDNVLVICTTPELKRSH